MRLYPWPNFQVAIITATLGLSAAAAAAQAPLAQAVPDSAAPIQSVSMKPSPAISRAPAANSVATAGVTSRHSMLDDPATPAKIKLAGDTLSINATNSSLSEVIRQVATQTGMQVEGNSRDQRVFGVYGPGSPPDVLSALLYDSGYNVVMVGSTTAGAPRRLVLSPRSATAATNGATTPVRSSDEDDDELASEALPPPSPNPMPPGPGIMPTPGQPKTPQQMLEELQRMHQGQQPPDLPHEQQ